MTTDQIIGERVHQIMWRRGIKQNVLAERLGVGQAAVSKKLHGDRKWTTDELVAVAQILEVPVGDLFPTTTRELAHERLTTAEDARRTTRGETHLPLTTAA